jgi:hypothetical protein
MSVLQSGRNKLLIRATTYPGIGHISLTVFLKPLSNSFIPPAEETTQAAPGEYSA